MEQGAAKFNRLEGDARLPLAPRGGRWGKP
jgi:hypothetical protein